MKENVTGSNNFIHQEDTNNREKHEKTKLLTHFNMLMAKSARDFATDLYIYILDAVLPIHVVSNHVATVYFELSQSQQPITLKHVGH